MEDYEKRYKEALSRAATELENCGADKSLRNMIYAIFPDELKESEDEKIRKALVRFHKSTIDIDGIKGADILAWLEKQGNSSVKWQKNTPDNKPAINHSVLMKTTHGVAEGYFVGSLWYQFGWSSNIKDSDVLAWMELSDLDEQGEQKPDDEVIKTISNFHKDVLLAKCLENINRELARIKVQLEAEQKPFDYEHTTITQKDFAPKPTEWSDEDENYLQSAENACEYQYGKNTSTILWLKSLKDRVQGKEEKK